MARITYLLDLLEHPEKIRALIREDILNLKERFGDERRTLIVEEANGDFSEEDLIAQDNVLISYSAGSYIKRMSIENFRAQGRGGRGIKGMATRNEDLVIDLLFARTLDYILFFTNKGRVYSSRVYELPEGSRTARGAHIANVLNLQPDETVSTMLVVADFEQAEYITLITRQARIKRMELSAFSNVRSVGLIAMSLDPSDSLDWARLTSGDEEFLVVTRNGKALRFHESAVRPMGRTAAGVRAMRLIDDDEVVSLDVVKPGADLFVLHKLGWGKRVSLDEYNAKGRYTQGMWTTARDRLAEIGPIVAARVVYPDDHITVMTSNGIVLRTQVNGVSRYGRMTRGVRVVNLVEGDTVAAVAAISHADLTRGVDGVELPDEGPESAPHGNGAMATQAIVGEAEAVYDQQSTAEPTA
jgi:DNA gyrase subunit A